MRHGMLILILLLIIPVVSADSATGTVSLEVIHPNYERDAIQTKSLETLYLEQESIKNNNSVNSNLITGNVVSGELSSEQNLKNLLWFLGIICFILALYLVRKVFKMRPS